MFCAINGTQVEVTFNKAPETAPVKEDFTIEGLDVLSVNAKAGSTTTFVVTTSAQTAGTTYNLVYKTQTKAFTAVQEVSTLQASSKSYVGQFGKSVTVEYTVLDQAGKPVIGVDVYVRAGSSNASDIANTPVVKTLTSDESGKIKFTYTRSDANFDDSVTAYVVSQPLVRDTNVRVKWTVSDVTQLTVEASQSGNVGHNTILEYDIDAKDINGAPLKKGEKVKVAFEYANSTIANAALPTVEQQLANGTWASVATNGGAVAINGAEVQLIEAGKAKIRVVYAVPAGTDGESKKIEVTPTFYYSETGNSLTNLTDEDSIFIAPSVSLVKQTPVLSLVEVKAGNQISTTGKKEYKLTAVDQFGNPFRGEVKLDALENADGLASTTGLTNYKISADMNGDTVFDKTGADKLTIDFGFNVDDKEDEDGIAIIKYELASGTSAELTPVAFVDKNGDDFISPNEVVTQAAKITFGQAQPSSIKVEAKAEETTVAGKIKFDVSTLDVEGNLYKPETPLVFELVKVANDGTETPVAATSTPYAITQADGTAVTSSYTSNQETIATTNVVDKKYSVEVDTSQFTVPSTNNDVYKLYVFADSNGDSVRQLDEVVGSDVFTTSSAILEQGKLTVDNTTTGGAIELKEGTINSAVDVGSAQTTGVTYTYELQDQGGNINAAATTVIWTITNPTDKDITVKLDSESDTVINAGSTKSFETATNVSGGTAKLKLTATDDSSDAVGLITVKAQAKSVSKTAQTNVTYFAPKGSIVNNSNSNDVTYTGTVKALNKDTDGDKDIKGDGTFFVLTTPVGDIVVDTSSVTTVDYIISGNTGSEASFEKALELGKTVKVEGQGNTSLTITLQ